MTEDTRQLIGHAVNWAVQIMNEAQDNQILLDVQYYEKMIKPFAETKYGAYNFPSAEGLKTKHGVPIAAYKVDKK